MTFTYSKVNETGLSLEASANKETGIVTVSVKKSEGDFLSRLKSVTLTSNGKDDPVYAKDVEGSDAVYYEIAENNKSLTLHNVKPGRYTVKIAAEYYGDALTKEFTMEGEVSVNPAPEMNVTSSEKDGVFTVSIQGVKDEANNTTTDKQISEWKSKVQTISVQGTKYDKIADFSFTAPSKTSTDYELKTGTYGGYELVLGGGAFQDGENTVIISADGYENKEITVVKEATGSTEPTEPTTPTEPAKPEKPSEGEVKTPNKVTASSKTDKSYNSYTELAFEDAAAWLNTVTGISYDGKTLSKMDSMYFGYGEGYYVDAENNVIALNPSIGYTAKDLVIYAENGKNLTLSVVSGGFMQPPTITIKENTFTVDKDGNLKA